MVLQCGLSWAETGGLPRKRAKAQLLHRREFVRHQAYRRLLRGEAMVQTWQCSRSKEAGKPIWSRHHIMGLKKGTSNTQGRRARDIEEAFMDDELAEQVDGLEIDDEGRGGRKGTSGGLSEQVNIEHALIPSSLRIYTNRLSTGSRTQSRRIGPSRYVHGIQERHSQTRRHK